MALSNTAFVRLDLCPADSFARKICCTDTRKQQATCIKIYSQVHFFPFQILDVTSDYRSDNYIFLVVEFLWVFSQPQRPHRDQHGLRIQLPSPRHVVFDFCPLMGWVVCVPPSNVPFTLWEKTSCSIVGCFNKHSCGKEESSRECCGKYVSSHYQGGFAH